MRQREYARKGGGQGKSTHKKEAVPRGEGHWGGRGGEMWLRLGWPGRSSHQAAQVCAVDGL